MSASVQTLQYEISVLGEELSDDSVHRLSTPGCLASHGGSEVLPLPPAGGCQVVTVGMDQGSKINYFRRILQSYASIQTIIKCLFQSKP